MKQEVIFSKLKLTNNKSCTLNNQIILNSMHRFLPKIFICEDSEEGKELISHGFVDTQFIAVTAYQNTDITDLKVKYNPYARGMIDKCSRMGMEQVSPQHQYSPYGQGMSPEHQNVHTSPLPGMSVPYQHPPIGSTPLTQTNGHVYPSSSDTFQQRFDIGHNSPESGVSYYETPYAIRTPNYMHVHGYKHPGVTPYVGSPGAPHPRPTDSDCLYSPGGSSGGALALNTRNPQFHRSPPIQSGQRSIPTSLVNISASSFGPNGQASLDSRSSLSTQRKVPASSQHLHGEHFLHRQESDMGKDSHYNHTSPFMASFLLTTKDDPEAEDEKDFGQLQEEAAKVTLNLLCRSPVRKRRK
ncbi:eomesodermin [Biomphalaria glabrata]|nr:eomesodermin [Biomphalaria glabrata]